MLSPELELAALDARHWTNWWRLLVPPRVLDGGAWALVVLDDGVAGKVIVSGRGAVDPATLGHAPRRSPGSKSVADPEPAEVASRNPPAGRSGVRAQRTTAAPPVPAPPLAAWAKALGVESVVAFERRVMGELSAEIEGALRLEMDLVEQGLVALRALKRHAGRGIWTEPALLELLPAPAYEPIQRTFDLLVPDGSSLIAYVIDDDRRRIHASIIAAKGDGDITRAATHRAIADLVPEPGFAQDWSKQYKRVLAAVEERYAKPSIALFLERATLLRIVTGPGDQLARELNSKHVVIDPAPAWLLGLLGGATVAAMAGRAASALASMLPQSTRDRASAIATRARDAMKDSGAHPFALLGFDPLELWSRLRHFYRE